MTHHYELSLVIPFYNEEKNVKKVTSSTVEAIENEAIDYELITVDNGSSDNTLKLLKELSEKDSRIKIVHIENNEGKGWGIINGLKKTSGEYVGFMDGDGQVFPGDILKVFKKIKTEEVDLCKTKRVVRKENMKRKIASKGYNSLLSLFFLTPSWDVHGNPKIMKRKCYEELNIVSKDWFIDTEILIKMHLNKYKIAEVPVEYLKRDGGESHIKLSTVFEFLKNLIRWRIILMKRK